MLVLSRRVDERINIGDDITVTVVRLAGNRVGIGIDAPQDMRILRGELADPSVAQDEAPFELSEREFAFAHQQACDRIAKKRRPSGKAKPDVFSGTVSTDGSKVDLSRVELGSVDRGSGKQPGVKPAPLSGFVSAS